MANRRLAAFAIPLLAFAATTGAAADRQPAGGWRHMRPLSGTARALVADVTRRSPLFRSMAAALENSDVVVYVTTSMSGFTPGFHGALRFVGAAAGSRYLLMTIDGWTPTADERLGLVGHELQHALEVAGAPRVVDQASFARFYGEIGWPSRAGGFETAAAQEIGRAVLREVVAGHRHAPAAGAPQGGIRSAVVTEEPL